MCKCSLVRFYATIFVPKQNDVALPCEMMLLCLSVPIYVQTQVISDETWKLIDGIWDKRVQEIKSEAAMEIEEDIEKPQLLMASHFF